ncbi:MAG: hypothetical protein LBD01_06765 [Puniceicoccales bacterium]|jgi:TolB protein|nr:hypothetical protein [Puniceicoccales bacterium]
MRFLKNNASFRAAAFAAMLLLPAALSPASAQAETIDGKLPTERISVQSSTPAIASLAKQAFNAHGDYTVDAKAALSLTLTKVNDTTVSATCYAPKRGTKVTRDLSGANLEEATLRACDAMLGVEGRRPFFAGKLAFTSDRTGKKEIYASDLFLASVRPLTTHGSISLAPRWTHDGTEVLYTTYANQNFTDIYAVNALNGRRRGVVVNARGTTIGAVSNPRTGQIAFASSARGDMDIYLADANGANARCVIFTKGVETDPAWSADGLRLALSSGAAGSPSIHVAKLPGGALQRIKTNYSYSTEPAWNPVHPAKIAFTYYSGSFGIAIVDTDTGKVSPVKTKPAGNYANPTWCADGRHLVATRIAGRSSRLALIDTEREKVTVISGELMANCTSPDYFLSSRK